MQPSFVEWLIVVTPVTPVFTVEFSSSFGVTFALFASLINTVLVCEFWWTALLRQHNRSISLMMPCDGLATCPGCTPPLAWSRPISGVADSGASQNRCTCAGGPRRPCFNTPDSDQMDLFKLVTFCTNQLMRHRPDSGLLKQGNV